MASRTKLLTDLSVTDLWKEVKDPQTIWGDLAEEPKRGPEAASAKPHA